MILAMDVDYRQDKAVAAGVLLRDWKDEVPVMEITTECDLAHDYVPGEFYRRELPCLLKLLHRVDVNLNTIVIDGYVYLGKDRTPGLGRYLYDAWDKQVAVVGVAKTAFKDTPAGTEIKRGNSQRPLYVTAVGIDEASAKRSIQAMHGRDRIPALLKRVDHLCRSTP
ncbi:MAG: endonuclease V [Halobacteria archaeon]|nr:endonuclease V [Halobacteria archaeon]